MSTYPYIVWKEEYLVGHHELDMHHRRMFTIINDLYDAMISHASDSRFSSLLRSALDYAHLHFQVEENLLRATQYPGLKAQEKAHTTYIRRLQELAKQPLWGSDDLSTDLFQFLKEWWLDHILKMDRAYATHLKGRKSLL